MPNKHTMRKTFYDKMKEWKKQYEMGESKKINLARAKAISNYEATKSGFTESQIDSQR